jgi:hypothetical protein
MVQVKKVASYGIIFTLNLTKEQPNGVVFVGRDKQTH